MIFYREETEKIELVAKPAGFLAAATVLCFSKPSERNLGGTGDLVEGCCNRLELLGSPEG